MDYALALSITVTLLTAYAGICYKAPGTSGMLLWVLIGLFGGYSLLYLVADISHFNGLSDAYKYVDGLDGDLITEFYFSDLSELDDKYPATIWPTPIQVMFFIFAAISINLISAFVRAENSSSPKSVAKTDVD